MSDLITDVIDTLEAVANTEAAEYVFKAVELLAPLAPAATAGTLLAIVKVSRSLAAQDVARRAAIAEILADAQKRAQDAADKFDH